MRHLLLVSILASLFFWSCQPSPPRTLVFNGKIYTADERFPEVEALVLEGQRILFAGSLADASSLLDPAQTDTLDLRGHAVFPGFVESHGHLMGMGRMAYMLDLSKARSFEEIVQMVADSAARRPAGSWIIGRGWHQDKWSDKPELVSGQPVHTRISAVSPGHPVMLVHASGHSLLANAKAMEIADIQSVNAFGDDGEIYRFPDGKPTGLFSETAQSLIERKVPLPTEAEEQAALEAAIAQCLREGVTTFQDAGADNAEIDRFLRAEQAGNMAIRLSVMLQGSDSALLEQWYARGPLLGDHLTVRAIKLYSDGALGNRGAWLLEPYNDRPGHLGNPVMPIDKIAAVAKAGLEHGFQVCTHAIGDRANREVLDRYEALFQAYPDKAKDHRFRIEHAQHLHPDDIPRFGKLGVIASMQGVHLSSDRPWAIDRLGRLRIIQGAYMWKALLDRGATVINGTDVPVEPLNPMACYYSLVTRKTLAGEPETGFEPEQKLSRMEALLAYTADAAYGSFRETHTGSLSEGKFADFVVLSNDLITADEKEILRTEVLQTWVDGKPVFVSGQWK